MSVEYSYGKEEIIINDNESLILEAKGDDGYEWKVVTYKSPHGEKRVGSYFTYDYSNSIEWMEYDENYIVILKAYQRNCGNEDLHIKTMFDIKANQLIEGSQEELLEIYNKNLDEKTQLTRRKF